MVFWKPGLSVWKVTYRGVCMVRQCEMRTGEDALQELKGGYRGRRAGSGRTMAAGA